MKFNQIRFLSPLVAALVAGSSLLGCGSDDTNVSVPDGGGTTGHTGPVDASTNDATVSVDASADARAGDAASAGDGASDACTGSGCETLSCSGGTLACGTSCVDVGGDPNNCGACGVACGSGQVCAKGKCAASCVSGETQCTIAGMIPIVPKDAGAGQNVDGGAMGGATAICVDSASDPNNCGGCGAVCPSGQLCSNGTCAVSCLAGLVECGGKCVDPTANSAFCGATSGCGGDAGTAGATCTAGQVCTKGASGAGTCSTTCAASEVNCGGTCIDPTTNRNDCGAKGDCSNANLPGSTANSAGAQCAPGTACVAASGANAPGMCAVTCLTGEVNCNGTCVDPNTNSSACGAKLDCAGVNAGAVCVGGTVCSGGACVATCAAGQVNCNGACVDPLTNGNYCGAEGTCVSGSAGNSAGQKCGAGTVCSGGTCQVTCQGGQIDCAGTCVDPMSNGNACGAAGNCTNVGAGNSAGQACAAGTVCSAGSCQAACGMGLVACDGTCIDPSSNNTHCGAPGTCGAPCAAGTTCTGGTCTASCGSNLQICGSACVDAQNDPLNCGAGCVSCSAPNVKTDACRTGTCAVDACTTGFADCNGLFTDGCEASLTNDIDNCGACGRSCGSGQYCFAGKCEVGGCGRFSGSVASTWATGTDLGQEVPGFSDITPIGANAFYSLSGYQQVFTSYANGTGVTTSLPYSPVASFDEWNGPAWVGNDLLWLWGGVAVQYDIPTSTWSQLASGLPGTYANSNTHDPAGNVYTVDSNANVLKFVPSTGAWSEIVPTASLNGLDEPHIAYDSCTNLLYVDPEWAGSSVFSVDPSSGAAVQLPDIPSGNVSDAFCSDNSGHLYAAGASYGSQFWQYTIATQTWMQIATPPFNVGDCGACTVSSDGMLYFSAGCGENTVYSIQLQ